VCRDAHLVDRGLVLQGGVLATPLRLGAPATLPAPALGAHSREVLAEAGLSGSEIDALVS
jgi:crotonobetainyl-CoA:carnitine CoA-transferase CaiB-like acyl-CoA transferase